MHTERDPITTAKRFLFGLTIFVGSYLLFQVQPLVGKIVTARFGGAAGIWCVCLLFFQLALLAGYTLTYLLSKLPLRAQSSIYLLLMVLSLVWLRIPPADQWLPDPSQDPVHNLLLLLSINLAVPCLLLSTVSGMQQNWFNLAKLGDPYPLYSLSNIGSLGALLAYPILVEPHLTVSSTVQFWIAGYGLLVLLTSIAALYMLRFVASDLGEVAVADAPDAAQEAGSPRAGDFGWWLGLSALGSVVLLTYTTYLTQDIAPVPMLWVLPLSLYLLTFIFCFADKSWYVRKTFIYGGPILWLVEPFLHDFPGWDLACVLLMIFSFCMVCNGEIVRRKPDPRYLPIFYLALAAGGAIGGIFVNLICPQLFNFYAERLIVIVCMVGLSMHAALVDRLTLFDGRWADIVYQIVLAYSCLTLAGSKIYTQTHNTIERARNLYGCISVSPWDDHGEHSICLASGTIIHGSQFIDKDKKRQPTQYFTRDSGVGFVDRTYRSQHPGVGIKYGIVGLGAGTIAAYGEKGDDVTFFELDPKVERFARHYFSFLSDCPATVTVVPGDARISMEHLKPQNYDILVVDAFNGDAIPLHLLTRECMELYLSHLKPDGILLIHVSNRYLNLMPVLGNLAKELHLKAFRMTNDRTKYVAMSRDPLFHPVIPPELESFYARLIIKEAPTKPAVGVWTDDYSNLASVLMYHSLPDEN